MNIYNDTDLTTLITAGKGATIELSLIKSKKEIRRVKELLMFRRGQLSLIRVRARELNLTEADLDKIHHYVHEKGIS